MTRADDDLPGERARNVAISAHPQPKPRRRFQVGLTDMIGAVLGLGCSFGLAIRLSPVRWRDEYVLVAIVLVPFVIWLCIRLIEQIAQLALPDTKPGSVATAARKRFDRGPVIWRMLVFTLLCAGLVAEVQSLFTDDMVPDWRVPTPRLRLLPVCGMLLLAGLVVGMRLVTAPPVTVQHKAARWASVVGWILMVTLCLAAGTLVAQSPFILFHAIEAVGLSTRYWDGSEWGVVLRTANAAPATALAGTAWVIAGVCVAHELHDKSRRERPSLSQRHFALVLLTLVAAGGAGYLLLEVVPTLSLELTAGLMLAMGPWEVAIITIGFGGFSAGLAAVAVAGTPSEPVNIVDSPAHGRTDVEPRLFRAATLVSFLLALSFTMVLRAIHRFPAPSVVGRSAFAEGLYLKAVGLARRLFLDFEEWILTGAFTEVNILILGPCLIWIIVQIVALLGTSGATRPSALDQVAGQPQLRRRFAFYAIILTALCLSALPILAVAGMVLYSFIERANW